MATHPHDHSIASALPLSAALAIIPSLPRPLLSRLVARAIERLDEMDGDADLEQDDWPEEDDPSGGSADDEGEPMEGFPARYGIDQTRLPTLIYAQGRVWKGSPL